MKILQSSDWHIGRRFKGLSQYEWQRKALDWLITLVKNEHVDVVLVSGDVYDSALPSAESVELLNTTLRRLTHVVHADGGKVDVFLIPGNHDNADRLRFGEGFVVDNLHLMGDVTRIAEPVVITRGDETLAVYGWPYLHPDIARTPLETMMSDNPEIAYPEGVEPPENGHALRRSNEAVVTEAERFLSADLARRRAANPNVSAILMAHEFILGNTAPHGAKAVYTTAGGRGIIQLTDEEKKQESEQSSDSEESLEIGGVGSVPAGVFSDSGLDYLALGHLHTAQAITVPGDDTPLARYSGALLAYSFGDVRRLTKPVIGNGRSVVLFDIHGRRIENLRTVPVESGQPRMVKLEGTIGELCGPMAAGHENDWVHATVHIHNYETDVMRLLKAAYPTFVEPEIVVDRTSGGTHTAVGTSGRTIMDVAGAHGIMDVLEAFVRDRTGTQGDSSRPTPKEREILQKIMESVTNPAADSAADSADHAGE